MQSILDMRLDFVTVKGWWDPPPCNSGIIGIEEDPNIVTSILIVTITGWGVLLSSGLCAHVGV